MKKKSRIIIVWSILILFTAATGSADTAISPADKAIIVFGVTPWASSQTMQKMYSPLMKHLENKLKKKVVFRVPGSYQELNKKITSRHIDIGFFSPFAYVQAKAENPDLKYLATMQKKDATGRLRDHYKGVIIAIKSSPFQTLEDLQGRRIAFTNVDSASGYIFPMSLLKQRGIEAQQYFSQILLLKKHDRVTAALASHMIEAGATWDANLAKAIATHGDIFQIIAETGPIPLDACAAGPHVSEKIRWAVTTALLTIHTDAKLLKLLKMRGFPYGGFTRRDDAFYDIVRQAGQAMN